MHRSARKLVHVRSGACARRRTATAGATASTLVHFDVGIGGRAADNRRAAGGSPAMLLRAGKRLIAGNGRGIAAGAGGSPAMLLHAGKRVIAGNSRGIAGGAGGGSPAMLLHAGKRMIALIRTLTRRRVAGCCAPGMTDVMALRRDRGNRRTRMRGNDAGAAQLRRVCGRRNGGMALIVVERQHTPKDPPACPAWGWGRIGVEPQSVHCVRADCGVASSRRNSPA